MSAPREGIRNSLIERPLHCGPPPRCRPPGAGPPPRGGAGTGSAPPCCTRARRGRRARERGGPRCARPPPPRARAVDVGGAGIRGKLPVERVERVVLEDQDRVGILEGGPEHAARVLERGGGQDAEARDVGEPALPPLSL